MSWLHSEEFREVTENIYLILLYKLPVQSLKVLGTIEKKKNKALQNSHCDGPKPAYKWDWC